MAETALTTAQADALSGTTDSDCAAVYPTIGESTYYTSAYRMLHRALLMAKMPGNECRVYQDGDLTCGVRAGKIQVGPTTFDHSGCTGESLTNNQTNYIFLTAADLAAGNSATVNTTGFPTDGTLYVPLATILTASGTYDYTDITDYRGRAILNVPGGFGAVVEANTAGSGSPNVLIAAESGKVFTNEGSTATNYHTLPTAAAGLTYTFIRSDASDDIRITANTGDVIVLAGTSTKAAGYVESQNQWDLIVLVAVDATSWVATTVMGTWTVETS